VSVLAAHRYLVARRVTQLGMLVLFWLGAHGYSNLLTGNLSSSRVLGTVPLSDPYAVAQILATGQALAATVLVGAAVVAAFYWVVGGRAFCAWVCPVNMVADAAAWLRRRFTLPRTFHVNRSVRSWIMVLALPVSALTGVAAFEWVSPIGMVHRDLIYGAGLGLQAVAAILLLDLFVVRHGWCGTLCPLGAFYALLGRVSLVRVRFDAERCDHCGDCVIVCPEPQVIQYNEMGSRGFIASGDCLNCGRCLEVCPRDAYRFGMRFGSASRSQ
jgi:ferredoxin-type protein NapH